MFFLHACNYALPQHEKIIYSEQSGITYTMQYIDSAGRGFQNAADTIVKNIALSIDDNIYSSVIHQLKIHDFVILQPAQKMIIEDILQKLAEDPDLVDPPNDSMSIDSLMNSLRITHDTMFNENRNIKPAFSSLQDKYICNSLAAMLESYGVKDYCITVGYSSLERGHNFKGMPWTLLN